MSHPTQHSASNSDSNRSLGAAALSTSLDPVASGQHSLSALVAADPARVLALSTAAARWEVFACLRGLGDLPGAAAVLDAIAEISGPLAKVLDAQAQLWPLLGRHDEAIAAAQDRLERFPSASGEVALARVYIATDRLEEPTEVAERLQGRDPRNTTALQLLARIALEQGDGESALEWYE